MKHKTLIISTLVFFILINTTYYWEERLGRLAMPAAVALFIFYIFLLFVMAQQVYLLVKEKFRDWQRIVGASLLLFVIIITYLKPTGLFNFYRISSKEVFIAQSIGSSECITLLKLTSNNRFIEQNKCFGNTEIRGRYIQSGDTLFFMDVDMGTFENNYYQYAVIKRAVKKGPGGATLIRYQNELDKEGQSLEILRNSLRP